MKIYRECCKNCLFSKDRIVSPERAKEIISDCLQKQSYFICHRATMENGGDIMCKSYYDHFRERSLKFKVSEALGIVEFIDQPEGEKLPAYKDFAGKKK